MSRVVDSDRINCSFDDDDYFCDDVDGGADDRTDPL